MGGAQDEHALAASAMLLMTAQAIAASGLRRSRAVSGYARPSLAPPEG